MNYSTYRITLDVRSTVANVQLTAKKGDAGRKVYITLSDKGNPCEIADGLYAVFAGVKPDGTLLYNKTTIENNTIIYEMTQQTTAVPGLVACEVKLFDSMSNLLTSPKLTILVDDVVVPDEEIVSQNEITALAELILDATASSNFATEAANAAIAAAGNAQVATESANGAAASANQATEGAITAASNANTAAGKATTEAGKATQATEKANLATTNANNAASDARAATEETNTARENIVQTTCEILTSLSNAVYAPSIECLATGDVVAVNDAYNHPLRGLTIYGKTTQNGTPTPEAPVELVSAGASGAIKTTVAGKNLIPYPYVDTTKTENGITFTDNGDGTVTVNGTATKQANFTLMNATPMSGIFALSGCPANGSVPTYSLQSRIDNKWSVANYDLGLTAKVRIAEEINELLIVIGANATVNNLVFRPQLEYGETATAYEPYKGQTITASTPNGLPGIPVSSGGNYTDENGQQWVSDEIDFARGVYVQRVGQATVTAANRWDKSTVTYVDRYITMLDESGATQYPHNGFCNACKIEKMSSVVGLGFFDVYQNWTRIAINFAAYGTTTADDFKAAIPAGGIKCAWVLAEPKYTALAAEELAAYAALHSNKPNTTVYNDAGAGLAVEYVADTKNYIDNKFTELQNAILSAGANI